MTAKDFINKKTLLFDGAMGTYYSEIKGKVAEKCELANIYDSDTILDIHKMYIEAGCNAIKTNTFAANRFTIGGDAERAIIKGIEIANKAVEGKDTFVFADIGPIQSQMFCDYKEVIDIFISKNIKNFIFETLSSAECINECCEYIKKSIDDSFIITSFAVAPDGYTKEGIHAQKLFYNVKNDKNIDAVGFNCVSGPLHILRLIKQRDYNGKPLSVMPNAGYPTVIENRTYFNSSPSYFADVLYEIKQWGADIIGGCCGTTPEYIKMISQKLNSSNGSFISEIVPQYTQIKPYNEIKNSIIKDIEQGKRVIAVELDPPIDDDVEQFMDCAEKLKNAGVDAVTIADCPIARARVDSSILACKLKRELKIEPLPHMTCRDRNINATRALLLGLSMEGVKNVLIVTGDPVPSAERDEVKSVYNFNSPMLAGYISSLNETVFKQPFTIYAALNVNAKNFDAQLNHAIKKQKNGVSAFLTQPIMTQKAFENLKKAREVLSAKILGGIIPVVSYRNACFMNNEISGINVSEDIIALYKDIDKQSANKLAVDISVKIAENISPYIDGFYIITPFKRVDIIEKIVSQIRELKL